MTDLPRGWECATLDDLQAAEPRAITDGPFGSNLKSNHYTDSGARVIRLQNIGDGSFVDERAYITLEHFENLRAHEIREGDIALASLGNDLPRACIVPPLDSPAIVKADCIRFRVHPSIDRKWALYALLAPQSKSYAESRIRGVGRPRLGLNEIRRIPIPVPPLAEQRRIVAALERHMSCVETGATLVDNARCKIMAMWDGLLDLLSTGPLRRVGELAQVQGGIQKQPRRRPAINAYPFLRVANVNRGELDLDDVHQIELFEGELSRLRLQFGDLLVVEGNGSPDQIGRAAMWRNEIADCVHQNHLICVRPSSGLDPRYLEVAWNSPGTVKRLRNVASSTSGLYTLSTAKIKALEIPVPKLPQQQEAVELADTLHAQVKLMRSTADAAVSRADALRRSLLREAFAGRLVPQDPDDEPASVLLERIRDERATSPKPKRTRRTTKQKDTLL